MQYFLLGLLALGITLLLLHGFVRASPAIVARQVKLVAGAAALTGAAVLLARGMSGYALTLAALGSWLIWGHVPGTPGNWGQPSKGNTSRVATDYLEMELDHESGAMRGRIVKGMFKERAIEDLKPAEVALLWQDCRFQDPQSAQLIEAYLDREHPSWREDMARGEEQMASGPDGRMPREEAYEILGLKPGASEDEIRRAHRELMLKMHPDRGGSTYLAAKINEAKDVLIG